LKNEATLLKGFDAAAAMREARLKSNKPAEQQEYLKH